jgi:hypothetical protein
VSDPRERRAELKRRWVISRDTGLRLRAFIPNRTPAVLLIQRRSTPFVSSASAAMTALYTEEIPLEHVQAEFSSKIGNQIVVLENMENEAFA